MTVEESGVVLVTGAAGRVGRRLVEALADRGERVRALVTDFETPPAKAAEVVKGNLLDKSVAKAALDGAGAVYHLAAILDYTAPRSVMFDVNVNGTKNLVEASRAGKFVYLSSTAVYGYKAKENPITEATPCAPASFYGKTKLMAERLVLEKQGIVVRSPDIFGRGFREGYEYVMAQLEKGKMPILGSGSNRIHWIHINDLIEALLLAKDRGRPGEVYLVAGKEARTQSELLSMLTKRLGADAPSRHVSERVAGLMAHVELAKSKITGRKPKVIPDYISKITSDRVFDISKARRELGFEPKMEYEAAAKELAEEHMASRR